MNEQEARKLEQDDINHLWHHYVPHQGFMAGKPPLIYVEGKGVRLKDINGKEYIDGTSGGVWCVNVGYGNDRIADAVAAQLKTLNYQGPATGNVPAIKFAAKFLGHVPGMNRVFYASSGSEANEKVFKLVRAIAHIKGVPSKKKVLYRERDYHGTTLATVATSGQSMRRQWFDPLPEGFVPFSSNYCYRCPFGKQYPGCDLDCAKDVEKTILREGPDTVGAILIETIVASGGMIPPVPEYLPMIRKICDKYDVLLAMDEVVAGMGRTGKMMGYQNYGIQPDITTLAKGVASGYAPISLTVTTEKVFRYFLEDASQYGFFRDISTFGGSASAAAAAYENLSIIEEENLVENARVMGDRLMDGLKSLLDIPCVGDVRGKGLMCGIELVADQKTRQAMDDGDVVKVVGELAKNGLIVGRTNRCFETGNNTLYLAPPLIITASDVDVIVETLRRTLTAK